MTIGSSLFKFLRTFRLFKTLRHSIFAYPLYSLLFYRELFNPYIIFEKSVE